MAVEENKPVLHWLRALAQILVVGAHIQFLVVWSDRIDLIKVIRPLFENSTIPFFILSGILFSLVSQKYTYSQYITKKLKTVIRPYFFVLLPVLAIHLFWPQIFQITDKYYFMTPSSLGVFLTSGKNSVNIAMWFFPVICFYFFISPFFKWLIANHGRLFTFMILFFTVAFIGHRPATTADFYRSALYFLFPYSLGLWLGLDLENKLVALKKFRIFFLVLFMGTYFWQVQYGPIGGLDRIASWQQMSWDRPDFSLLQKVFLTLALIGLLSSIKPQSFLAKIFNPISNWAFGIHLYHGFIVTLAIFAFGKISSGAGILEFLAWYLLIILTSLGLCVGLTKAFPRLGSYLFSVSQTKTN